MITKATANVIELFDPPVLDEILQGGSIDHTPIGVTIPDVGWFTNLHAQTLTVGDLIITGSVTGLSNNSAFLVPTGMIMDFGGTAAPTGWLLCDGSAVSRVTFVNLFTAIGVTWGPGDGSTTFNLPNFARRVAVGSGGTAVSPALGTAVGNSGGEEVHTLTQAELPSYSLPVADSGHVHAIPCGSGAHGGPGGPNLYNDVTIFTAANTSTAVTGITVSSGGGNGPHNVMQPACVVLKCIKT